MAYRDFGDETDITTLTSQCGTRDRCIHCKGYKNKLFYSDGMHHQEKQDKNLKLYIVATFNIHNNEKNLLECGPEINKNEIEKYEAFLWAVDQVSMFLQNIIILKIEYFFIFLKIIYQEKTL